MRTQILGVGFDNVSPSVAVERFISLLGGPAIVVTPNPEMVMLAQKDAEFAAILADADLVVPDGIGVVWASKYTQQPIEQRVPGIELAMDVMESPQGRASRWFFLGGAAGVAEAAAVAMQAKYGDMQVVGTHHGFFNSADEHKIIEKIIAAKPDVVLVGLGFPRQEKWMAAHKDMLGAVLMGVGGSFDVMSGKVKRAPKFFQKLRLEWFYRLLRQPQRIWRQRVLLKFVRKVRKDMKR